MQGKLYKKQISIEETTSRLPSLFPYLEYDELGVCRLHVATDSPEGAYGKIIDSLKVPCDVTGDTFSYVPYQYILDNEDLNIIFSTRDYRLLGTVTSDDYVVNRYIRGKEYLKVTRFNRLDNGVTNYIGYQYAQKTFDDVTNDIIADGYITVGQYNMIPRRYRDNYSIYLFGAPVLNNGKVIWQEDYVSNGDGTYYYVNEPDNIIDEETYQSLEKQSDYVVWEYVNTNTGSKVSKEYYETLSESEQQDYNIYSWLNLSSCITHAEYVEISDDEGIYKVTHFYNKNRLSFSEYDSLSVEEQNKYTPYTFIKEDDIINTNDYATCEQCEYFPLDFRNVNDSTDIIPFEKYLELNKVNIEDFKIYSVYSQKKNDVKLIEDYLEYVDKYASNNSNRRFAIKSYINTKNEEVITPEDYDNIGDQTTKDEYIPNELSTILLKGGEYYSYRTIMYYYYKFKDILGSDNEFIKYVNDGIGRITIEDAVNKYNEEYAAEIRITDADVVVPQGVDIVSEPYDYLINLDNYIINSNGSDNNVQKHNGKYYVAAIYKERSGDKILTASQYFGKKESIRERYYPYKMVKAITLNSDTSERDDAQYPLSPSLYVRTTPNTVGDVYSYINKTDSDNVITVDVYNKLNLYGAWAYEPKLYVNLNDPSDIITVEAFLSLDEDARYSYVATEFTDPDNPSSNISYNDLQSLTLYGKNDYQIYRYYIEDSVITSGEFNNLTADQQKLYEVFGYSVDEEYVLLSITSYNTELDSYGKISYVPYNYRRFVGEEEITVDEEGKETEIVEQYDYLTLEEYENLGYKCIQETYEPNEYARKVGNTYVDTITNEGFNNLSPFGKNDYIVFRNKYEVRNNDGYDIEGFENDVIVFDEAQYMVPSELYLSTTGYIMDEMVKLKVRCYGFYGNDEESINEQCCDCHEFYVRGGDKMIRLCKMLNIEANRIATELYSQIIEDKDNGIYKRSTYNFNMLLSGQGLDNGYLTTYENKWEPGDYVAEGEIIVYTDENGFTQSYVCTVDGGTTGYDKDTQTTTFNEEDFEVYGEDDDDVPQYSTVTGYTESKLKDCRLSRTYFNIYDDVERPSRSYDWLFYYRKGAIITSNISHDINGNILFIDVNEPKKDLEGYVINLDAFGNIITNITYDNERKTITFEYVIGAHLKAKLSESEDEGYVNPYTDEITGNKTYLYDSFVHDTSSKYGAHCGIKYTETYIYDSGGELDNLITALDVKNEFVQISNDDNTNSYVKHITEDEYNALSKQEQMNYVEEIINLEGNVVLVLYAKTITEDEYLNLDDCHFEEYIEYYCYKRIDSEEEFISIDAYEELGEEEKANYIRVIRDEEILYSNKKFQFNLSPNMSSYDIEIGTSIATIDYVKAQYEYYVNNNDNSPITLPLFKQEYLNGIHYPEEIDFDVDITRGSTSAIERHLRLGEVKTLNDMVDFRNGSFFNIQSF